MYFKQKLAYMALGCLFTIIGYTLASLSGNPVNAQSQRDKSEPTIIDEIVCRQLQVVNADGETVVEIKDALGGFIGVKRPNGKAAVLIGAAFDGGSIDLFNKGGKRIVQAGVHNKDGGLIITQDKHGNETGRLP